MAHPLPLLRLFQGSAESSHRLQITYNPGFYSSPHSFSSFRMFQAGIQEIRNDWMPASAGMTMPLLNCGTWDNLDRLDEPLKPISHQRRAGKKLGEVAPCRPVTGTIPVPRSFQPYQSKEDRIRNSRPPQSAGKSLQRLRSYRYHRRIVSRSL